LSLDKSNSPRGEFQFNRLNQPPRASIIPVPELSNLSRDKQADSPRGELKRSSTG